MTDTALPAASRRSFLRGAAVAGTAVWAVPAAQLIGLDAASAATPSASSGTRVGTQTPGADDSDLLARLQRVVEPVVRTGGDLLP